MKDSSININNLNNLNAIRDVALSITKPVPAISAYGTPFMVEPNADIANEGKYSVNNGIIAFVKGYIKYVIPALEGVEAILQRYGFTEENCFNVPFSNGEKPADLRTSLYWEDLLALTE